LTEVVNNNLVGGVVKCYGISQDPKTKNYVLVMEHMKEGNLRQLLVRQGSEEIISLKDKVRRLGEITGGLSSIHYQNLIHRDFHSGNILNKLDNHTRQVKSYIADLGLSCPINHQKQKEQIFGVLPYVAPEVLRGQPYTKAADIYSFGIIAYELLAQAYPYPKTDDTELSLKVCQGHRPNIDKIPLPQEVKDLIKRCWDADPKKRPSSHELSMITS
jgi:serine/threonine protein kinase